ncbi:hypothetical protein PHMEG_00033550 [Phytophthora megakarya]|uniref:Uncharacterized protein n=1 Tax=Phytophthora megakarya TaxID=4795 RepID=A0A225USU6_9STRA|nr:hypothetical protein PHMEG_00033550 [Phytophthora megakarya]
MQSVFDPKDQNQPVQRHKILLRGMHVYLCDLVRPGNYRNNLAPDVEEWCRAPSASCWTPRVGRGIQMRGLGKRCRRRHNQGNPRRGMRAMLKPMPVKLGTLPLKMPTATMMK